MKYFKTIPKHVEEVEILDKVVCDLCKQAINVTPMGGRYSKNGSFVESGDSWEHTEIRIFAKIGETYPECDSRDGWIIDVCAECFEIKVLPMLPFRKFDVEESHLEGV